MDEAEMFARGRYYNQHGDCNRSQALLAHLQRVCEIGETYGFRFLIWSDMFFKLATGGQYYAQNAQIDESVREKIPANVELIYWDYYSADEAHYDGMIEAHQKLKPSTWFAGGLWKWTGYAPHNGYSMKITKAALASCREHGVQDVFLTMWGDDGGECSPFTLLPSLFYASELAKGETDDETIKAHFAQRFGAAFDDFMQLDLPGTRNGLDDNVRNLDKFLLYNDPFMGMMDQTVLSGEGAQFGTCAERLETLAGRMKDKPVARQLRSDADLLRQGIVPNGSDRFLAAVYPEMVTAMDYLPKECLVCVSESGRTAEALKGWLSQMKADVTSAMESGILCGPMAEAALPETDFARQLERFPVCQLESLPTSRYLLAPKALLQIDARQLSGYGGSLETAVTDLTHYLTSGCRVMVLCGGQVRARNLQELLEARRIPAALDLEGEHSPVRNVVLITLGTLSAGCEYPALQLAVLTEGQLTTPLAGKAKKARPKRDSNQQKLQSYADLTPGDLVVHQHHGIGRFVGMIRMPTDGVEKDYIKIAYAGSDCLYVPATALDLVSKYIGAGEDTEHTRLNKLGGTEWAKTTHRAKAAAKDLAEGLIKLYAQRQREAGHAFSPDSPWQQEFEDAFDYTETDDQLQAIREIKADMEKPVPMDRLLCGDVGYGKTEVALRAVMKCILDGKQAAILVPTTVLAQQHYATAMNRFRSFPVTVEVLSRFRTPKQTKEILERAAQGKIDLLIGTHRLLAKNLVFKDLGLLVIDEEQRFGVTHKEKLRERVRQVDTLTLSATPIPRTLNMALSGIRDMSTIEEPPRDRQPVQTYVMEHEWPAVAEAIRRELNRGGQVYYLHNRVENIESTTGRLRQWLGEDVRLAMAHGKMSEQELSRVMQQMADGEVQVLVCTTIIETGIDIPNVNTLIIEDADRLGLAQLHQIRGRIGRSSRRAYAYLTYRPGKVLTEVASKRLSAIREYVDFGAGFRIAMRDLEIRGAGNLLGPEQSGYMMSVGYDMYLKLLNDAVLEQQGKGREIRPALGPRCFPGCNITTLFA